MNIGIIGFGNLGKAFTSGLLTKNLIKKENIFICAKSIETIDLAINEYGVNASTDIIEVLQKSDTIVFAVKPAVFNELLKSIDISLFHDKPIISLMAGATIEHIRETTKSNSEIIRAMPNLAIASGDGIIGYTKADNKNIIKFFQDMGLAFKIAESDIEKITVFSTCGLGFTAYILDSFVSAGVALGLNEELSRKIVLHNFESAINMGDYKKTIAAVATKGGATEQGLQYLLDNNMPATIYGAIKKAYDKVK